jgi:hypothetical protein
MSSNQQPDLNPTQAWQQVLARDASASFVYAVASTGIFCRLPVPAGVLPQPMYVFSSDPPERWPRVIAPASDVLPLGERREAATVARLCRYLAATATAP